MFVTGTQLILDGAVRPLQSGGGGVEVLDAVVASSGVATVRDNGGGCGGRDMDLPEEGAARKAVRRG